MDTVYEKIHYENSEHLYVNAVRNLSYRPHWHQDYELVYVKKGSITVNINTHQALLEKGSVSICCSNDVHNYYSRDVDNEIIVVRFRTYFVDPQIQRLLVEKDFTSVLIDNDYINSIGIHDTIEKIFTGCYEEMTFKKPFYEHTIKGYIMLFFSLALRHFCIDSYKNTTEKKNITLMQDIIKYINKNLTWRDLTLDVIANQFHLSPFYFSRLFKQMFGLSFKKFLNHYRINKSKNLLYATNKKITDIAYECGYGSVRQFNRAFLAETGINPSAYREQYAPSKK